MFDVRICFLAALSPNIKLIKRKVEFIMLHFNEIAGILFSSGFSYCICLCFATVFSWLHLAAEPTRFPKKLNLLLFILIIFRISCFQLILISDWYMFYTRCCFFSARPRNLEISTLEDYMAFPTVA